jgi:hypothetical protein
MPEQTAPDECANCGAAIPRGAKACPECGADERTGWRDNDAYDGLDIEGAGFSVNETPDETPRRSARDVNGIAWYWWCVGVGLIVMLVLGALALR